MIFRLGCRGDAPMPPRDAHSKNLLIISALVSKIFSYLLSFFLSFFLSLLPRFDFFGELQTGSIGILAERMAGKDLSRSQRQSPQIIG